MIRGAAAKDGDTIIIYDVGYASSDDKDALQGSSERLGRYNYPTSYSYGTEWEAQNYFVISVAKGQTTTLTRAFEQTIGTSLKVGTPFEITAELKKSVTARYETTQKFAGPPETSAYNSREYRVLCENLHMDAKTSRYSNGKNSGKQNWSGGCAF